MKANPELKSEFIGEITEAKESSDVRDLFSTRVFALEQQPNEIPPETGSIILGRIRNGLVHPLELLASPQSVHATLYRIAAKHGLNPLFSPAVISEVDTILENPGLDDPSLLDMEDLAFCTIDGADTRDLDQALYIDKVQSQYRVFYALADAAYYVRPGMHLFDEALKRGSSYYLPGLMIPMLPRPLCEGLISLNENVVRRAMVFQLNLNESGVCVNTQIFHSRIRSRAKLSFQDVQTFLDYPDKHPIADPTLGASLKLLQEVGELRLQLAEERNIVRYRRYEVNVKLGSDGFRFNILDDLRTDVEQYNEQLSLLCNVEGARFLRKDDNKKDHIHPIYRVHPHPPPAQIASFERLLQSLIKIHHLDPELWSWQHNGLKTLANYLKSLPAIGLQSRIAQAIHRQAVMVNVRSSFSHEAARHYGVGADVYARFSAPMREIVGVFLHKEVAEKQSDKPPILSKTEDDVLREQIIDIANRSKSVQRQITHEGNRLVLDQIFSDDMQHTNDQRPSHMGTVLGMDNSRIYVLLDKPKVELKIYTRHLESELDTTLSCDDEKVVFSRLDTNEPIIKLGDSVSVYVKDRDKIRDRWILLFNSNPLANSTTMD